ncbi:MAG: Hsp20/alpha crystallin family protein [Thermodesulfobacteriota bacterium]|jgi:HSP20 family molecular chaperone IbpA|nr:MAG: Hsp20/alpha crystallin family protein [Thermodesulfobacteriota bacterium]
MAEKETKDLQVKEKQAVATPAEQTRAGLVFTPAVDIFETDRELTLLADLPGVKKDGLTIDLDNNQLTIVGEVSPPEGSDEVVLLREYQTGRYFRQFALSDAIDQSKIEASLADGVLRLDLPKVEAAKPRKIAVKTG